MKTQQNNELARAAIIASALLLCLLFLSYLGGQVNPSLATFFSVAIVLFQIVVPIEILKRYHLGLREANIYAHNIDGIFDKLMGPLAPKNTVPDLAGLKQELIHFTKISILILLPYTLSFALYYALKASLEDTSLVVSLNFPPRLFMEIITQIFVVALPEEFFYRGFLQSALLKKWPNHRYVAGLPLGFAIILVNLIFALAHVASTLDPARLLTFFPGLIFSYLIYKNKSLISCILFHALCNLLAQILYASFYLA